MAKFTDRALKAMTLASGRKDALVFDDECPGLGLRITARSKSFLVQWTDPATKRKVREPIGVWGSITIDQARAAARARLGDVARGIDPAAERRQRKAAADAERADQALTLDALVKQWAALHLASRRPRYAAEAQRSIRTAFRTHLNRPASKLTRADVVSAIDRLLTSGRAAMAAQTVSHTRACFAWAEKGGRVAANPCRALPVTLTKAERDRVLTDDEVAEIWSAAGGQRYPFGPFFRLALLTLQRREEVAGMCWSEMSLDLTLWTIPASRMKNSRAHDVHLSEAARAILRAIPRRAKCDLVFTTNGKTSVSGFSRAKAALDKAIVAARAEVGGRPAKLVPWRLHDFRRTGVSRLAALGFDSIVADKLLAHKPAKLKGVASVYQRHDFATERRKALDAWATHVTGGSTGANVVPLRGRG